MKSLKSILESIKPWGSHLVWNMKGAINDNYGKFREIYNDKVRATSTIRISLSYVTTNEEINKFLKIFKLRYEQLSRMMRG